ncbi:MAG: hypothetical protein NVSMB42_07640 [Herpetosiphon sp.]
MLFRTATIVCWLVLLDLARRFIRSPQPPLVRTAAVLASGVATVYVAVLAAMTLLAAWPMFTVFHATVGTLLLASTAALHLIFRRYGQPLPIVKQLVNEGEAGRVKLVKDYVALTKPRIISLLLLTTLAAMLLAIGPLHRVSLGLVIWTLVGGYLAAGGANAINMYLDRDVDALMGRTSRRPLPSSRIEPRHALIFGLILNLLAFLTLTASSNVLTASLAIGGSVFYVVVYTRLLKRTTTQNIVIGGAAGAFPPLVGWAAVTGEVGMASLLLFAIIFYWTPPHFWALALLRRADYARAGIPMLPVVHGEAETKMQILLYTFLMVAVTVLPTPLRVAGPLYLILALALGSRFILLAYRLFREPAITMAWPLYKYSLLYLALLFGALVVDHLVMLSYA